MVEFECPWCGDGQPLEPSLLQQPETLLTCAECGTSVELVDAPVHALDLAA